MHVCDTAVGVLGDMNKFPDEWLFKHRWGKGKKDAATTLPNGAKFTFLTVGGRTSCVVPSVQKKTGAVAGDLKNGEETEVKKKPAAKKGKAAVEEDEDKEPEVEVKKEPASRKRKAAPKVEDELTAEKNLKSGRGAKKSKAVTDEEEEGEDDPKKMAKTSKADSSSASAMLSNKAKAEKPVPNEGRRRSGRVSRG